MLLTGLSGRPLSGRGIGPAIRARLEKLDIHDMAGLLAHLPRNWQDRRACTRPEDVRQGDAAWIEGVVTDHIRQRIRGGRSLLKIRLDARGCPLDLVCFNRDYLARTWPVGTRLFVWGSFERELAGLSTAAFEAIRADDPQADLEFGRLVPVYGLTEGVTQRTMRRIIFDALAGIRGIGHDLPDYLVARRRMRPLDELLLKAHYPGTEAEGLAARDELVYIEFLLFQTGILARRARLGRTHKAHSYSSSDVRETAEAAFGFRLTAGQASAWEDLRRTMSGTEPMQVLLLGDVGSGKTAIAAMAILLAVRSGVQVVMAAPTVILARQLAERMERYLAPLGVRTAFLSGGMALDERKRILADLAGSRIDLLSGTHALFHADVIFSRLGLVVIDEQHRFGVKQRKALRDKGKDADYLAMSATPIPRTLAMALYGDYGSIRIEGIPEGRIPVETHWLQGGQGLEEALSEVEARIRRGEQACFVYPSIGDEDDDSSRAATAAWKRYARTGLAARGISLLHGRLDDREKESVMAGFMAGAAGLLVATSVIEVGIDNPRLTAIIIFGAERFGLSQIHQLRGRVGRGGLPSVCWLVTDGGGTESGFARMKALVESTDGFKIAEADLALRGPGDFLGLAQTGLPRFMVADIARDGRMLELARRDASLILRQDPLLESPHHARFVRENPEGGYE
ncbi:MAG TPA: ATP-dependent DNA helicase RecG [Spirochaetota bacterium]|nr:ATP-dependent DNA helicase RecG [Spirochaetota bacterium]